MRDRRGRLKLILQGIRQSFPFSSKHLVYRGKRSKNSRKEFTGLQDGIAEVRIPLIRSNLHVNNKEYNSRVSKETNANIRKPLSSQILKEVGSQKSPINSELPSF